MTTLVFTLIHYTSFIQVVVLMSASRNPTSINQIDRVKGSLSVFDQNEYFFFKEFFRTY